MFLGFLRSYYISVHTWRGLFENDVDVYCHLKLAKDSNLPQPIPAFAQLHEAYNSHPHTRFR